MVVLVFSLLYLPRANLREDRCILVHNSREFMMGRHGTGRSMVIGTCDYDSSSSHISVERKERWENWYYLDFSFSLFYSTWATSSWHRTVPHTFKVGLTFPITLSEMPLQRNKEMWPTFYGDSNWFKLTIKNNHEGIKLLLFNIFEIFHNKISMNHV